jgi:TPR repeat protein
LLLYNFSYCFGKLFKKNENVNLLKKADVEYRKGNLKVAIDLYSTSTAKSNPKDPKIPEALFKLAQIYLNDLKISKEAINSLFMIGFVYTNELKNYDNARDYYRFRTRRICKRTGIYNRT